VDAVGGVGRLRFLRERCFDGRDVAVDFNTSGQATLRARDPKHDLGIGMSPRRFDQDSVCTSFDVQRDADLIECGSTFTVKFVNQVAVVKHFDLIAGGDAKRDAGASIGTNGKKRISARVCIRGEQMRQPDLSLRCEALNTSPSNTKSFALETLLEFELALRRIGGPVPAVARVFERADKLG
jgi:hypothetical protein